MGSKLTGLVTGGFDKLGYIPIGTAVVQCEGQARYRVEKAVDRRVLTPLLARPCLIGFVSG